LLAVPFFTLARPTDEFRWHHTQDFSGLHQPASVLYPVGLAHANVIAQHK
jgi:hypothetical protein